MEMSWESVSKRHWHILASLSLYDNEPSIQASESLMLLDKQSGMQIANHQAQTVWEDKTP